MNWLSSLKNQTILLALVGFSIFNGLLCAVMLLRENSNATQIIRLETEAKAAAKAHEAKLADLKRSMDDDAARLRADLASQARQADQLKASLDTAKADVGKLRADLTDTDKELKNAKQQGQKTSAALAETSKSLNTVAGLAALFRTNHPWLADAKQRPPWEVQIEKLLNELKKGPDDKKK